MEYKDESTLARAISEPVSRDLDGLWRAALGEIEIQISRPNFITWFKNSALIDKQDFTATVALPNAFAKEWIENKYSKVVLGALRSLEEGIKKVEFVVVVSKTGAIAVSSKRSEGGHEAFSPQPSLPEFRVDPETSLNPRYSLQTFIVGKSNELCVAAAQAVVEEVGKKYNPLFIYGGVGLGKTHLVQAIGNEIHKKHSGKVRVRYVPSEKFTNEVVWAMRNQRMESIKEKYRLVDVLIIDDIQFIIGKERTEEEFFHTFNALYENSKQIIVSSDKPPKFMPNLEERLRSRFEGGMIIDIGYPDFELRYAILRSKLQERGALLSDRVLEYVASKIQRSFRELEGILNRILFVQKTRGVEITPKLAEEIVNEIIQEPVRNINPNQIVKAVADVFEISTADLVGHCRKKEVVEPRQIAMYLMRELLNLSYPNIGERMGKRDHTTAIYAFEKIAEEVSRNQLLGQKILMIKELINKE